MAGGKWVEGLAPDMPLDEAARIILASRLAKISQFAADSVSQLRPTAESVHQLRVWTRRSGAAISQFESCLPRKTCKTLTKTCRRLRKTAGAARDWDVFLIGLRTRRKSASPADEPGLDFLTGFAEGQREAAQAQLERVINEIGPSVLDEIMTSASESVRKPKGDPRLTKLSDLADVRLRELMRSLDEACEMDLADYDNLHQVRIAGKQLRYAMELFAPCYPPEFRTQIYPAIEEMQEILGSANDSHTMVERLKALTSHVRRSDSIEWKRIKPFIKSMLAEHESNLERQETLFAAWLRKWREFGAVLLGSDLIESKR